MSQLACTRCAVVILVLSIVAKHCKTRTGSCATMLHSLSDCVLVFPSAVDGEFAVPRYLVNGFHRRTRRTAVEKSGIDWASFAKRTRAVVVQEERGTLASNKIVTFISQVLSKTSSAGKPLIVLMGCLPPSAASAFSYRTAPCQTSGTSPPWSS